MTWGDSVGPAEHGAFRVGQRVRLLRALPGLRVDDDGVVRGLSTSASGVSYVVRFAQLTRVVAEPDLAPPKPAWTPFAPPVGV